MFESIYDDLTDMEKKQFYNTLLHEVQVFEEEQENGQIIKSMRFKFPVYYNGEFTDVIFRDKKETVETVITLSRKMPDDIIEIDLNLDELDLTAAEAKATYPEIKEYVLKHHGLKVSSLYIAQVKRKCGLDVGANYNLPSPEGRPQLQVTPEKETAIRDALKHFAMI
jgi:site-specific DNA recombinase